MLLKRCLLCAALFFAFTRHELLAQGAKVVVHLKDGRQMAGELHSVSDNTLVVSWQSGAEHISQVNTKEIRQVVMKNKPQVILQLKNGRQMTGKLYSVSDSSVMIDTRKAAAPNGGLAHNESMTEIRNQEIQKVIIKGKKNIGKGMGLGFLIGAGTGAVIGFADGDDPCVQPEKRNELECAFAFFSMTAEQKAVVFGILGGGAGLVVGGIAGVATSTRTKETLLSDHQSFSVLKPLSRYPERGPQDKW